MEATEALDLLERFELLGNAFCAFDLYGSEEQRAAAKAQAPQVDNQAATFKNLAAVLAVEAAKQGIDVKPFTDVEANSWSYSNYDCRRAVPQLRALLRAKADASRPDSKTTRKKKLPPHDVNDCARYILQQRKLIDKGERPADTKKALIAEHLGTDDTSRMEKQLLPSRFGWLLDINGQADK